MYGAGVGQHLLELDVPPTRIEEHVRVPHDHHLSTHNLSNQNLSNRHLSNHNLSNRHLSNHSLSMHHLSTVRTGSGTGPPRGKGAPRVGTISTVFRVMAYIFRGKSCQ